MPPQQPNPRHKLYVYTPILLIYTTLSVVLFFYSFQKFYTWNLYVSHLRRTNDLVIHTTLFVGTCAPLSGVLGIVVSTLYYMRKHSKYGSFTGSMRRKGRGYWIDPRDEEERKEIKKASELNKAADGKAKGMLANVIQHTKAFAWRSEAQPKEVVPAASHTRRRISLNPYGWTMRDEPVPVPETLEMGNLEGVVGQLSRSDSIRTCDNDVVTKKGVVDIWLSGLGKGKKG